MESSDLIKIIPSEDGIFYSAILGVSYRVAGRRISQWQSHVILTNNGIAFTSPIVLPIQHCGINNGIFFYVPWYVGHFALDGSLRIGEDPKIKLFIFSDKNIDQIKPRLTRERELKERGKLLIKRSKTMVYDQLLPILKS